MVTSKSRLITGLLSHGIKNTAATLAALSVIGGTLWAAGDYTGIRPVMKNEFIKVQQTLNDNQKVLLQLRFQLLMQKKQYGTLDFLEQQELCQISHTLGYFGIPGC